MTKVLLVGNYGAGNLGDDLLMKSSVQQLNKLNLDYKIVCTGSINGAISMPPAGFRSFFKFKWLNFFRELMKSDVVVFGGGGLLNREEPRSLLIWGQVIVWAKLFRKKVYMAGQSFSSVSRFLRFLLSMVDFVSVRDQYSLSLVKGILAGRVVLSQDLAWSVDFEVVHELDKNSSDSNSICLNLREFQHVDIDYLKTCVIGLLEEISTRFQIENIYLLPFGEGDIEYCLKVLCGSRFEKNTKVVVSSLEPCLMAISESRIAICERLHASITCMHLDKQLLSLSYSSKVFALLDMYKQNAVINLRKETPVDFVRIVNTAIERGYKKPQPTMDEVFRKINKL